MVTLPEKECPYCLHKWIMRVLEPVRCPRCKRVIAKIETGVLSAKIETPAAISERVTS